ncbi:MAG: hypothetical protein JNK05_29165 [Myxococcales bacterium]|nr:hypothetical protein [Myxococcales bacterium]
MRSTLKSLVVLVTAGAIAACTSSSGQPNADARVADVQTSVSPADGGGVCCAPTIRTGCSPGFGYRGGWAASAEQCAGGGGFDGCPFEQTLDERGCPVINSPGMCTNPCGAAPDVRTSDATAPADSGGD